MKKIISIFLVVATLLTMSSLTVFAEEKFATVEALQFAKNAEPTIDGVVSATEWGSPTVANADANNPVVDLELDGTRMEFSMWTRYNFQGFYLAVVAYDDQHCNARVVEDRNSIWNGDCLQVRLDAYGCTVDQGLNPTSNRDGNWHSSYNEFAFALGDDGVTYAYSWHGVVDHEDLTGGNGRYVVKHNASKQETTYELFIPWEVILQTLPHVGTKLGFAISVNDGDKDTGLYKNHIEWGTGVMTTRNKNIYGSNRLVFVSDRATGGDELADPNAPVTLPPIETITSEKFLLTFNETLIKPLNAMGNAGTKDMEYTLNDDGSIHMALTGADPQLWLDVNSLYAIEAGNYRYLALYLKTNETNWGEMFFTTSASPTIDAGVSVMSEYFDVEGGQIVVLDFQYFMNDEAAGFTEGEWNGRLLQLRFDPVNEVTDTLTSEMTLYGIGFFNNLEDAQKFNVEGITVETDPAATFAPTEDTQEAPAEDTAAPDTDADTNADTNASNETAASTDAETTGEGGEEGGNTGLIIAIVAVAVVAVAAVVFIILKKKKA